MRTITTLKNQTVFDIAIQHYGDVALFDKVVEMNTGLRNDYSAATASGVQFDYEVFDMSFPLLPGQQVLIDPMLVNAVVMREIRDQEIISFDNSFLL